MSQQRYASDKRAWGICDICSWRVPHRDLRMEPISAYGSPSNAPSGLMACPRCFDEPHPQSFLPLSVQAAGSDPEAIRNPRPDIYFKTFAVKYILATSTYSNSSKPLILARGFNGLIKALGTYGGYSATTVDLTGITVHSVSLPSPSYAILEITVSSSMPIGEYVLTMVDGVGNQSSGQIVII